MGERTVAAAGPSTGADDAAPDCVVIVVAYNSAQDLPGLLESLPAAAGDVRLRVVVVDNASVDGSADVARAAPGVECVEAGANLGYAGAINVGRAHAAAASSLLILNPDLSLQPDAVRRLHEALADPAVGVAVPMLLDERGALYPSLRREPSLLRALGDALFGSRFAWRPGWLSEMVRDEAVYARRQAVDWATGAAVLVSAACDEAVGPWDDERFFLYSEETDFAARVRAAGFAVVYVPLARARHRGGGSGRSPALVALMAVNRIRYYEKHHGRFAAVLFRGVVVLHELLRAADAEHRLALRTVLRRSRWSGLPGGQRPGGGR